jgi:hypothetical protein
MSVTAPKNDRGRSKLSCQDLLFFGKQEGAVGLWGWKWVGGYVRASKDIDVSLCGDCSNSVARSQHVGQLDVPVSVAHNKQECRSRSASQCTDKKTFRMHKREMRNRVEIAPLLLRKREATLMQVRCHSG